MRLVNRSMDMRFQPIRNLKMDDRNTNYQKLLPADWNKLLKKGAISMQSESEPDDFRKGELLNLGDN